MYLDWHHLNMRRGGAAYVWFTVYMTNMTGLPAPPDETEEAKKLMLRSLKRIETIWLPADRSTKFMFGDEPSIADLSLACELTQLEGAGHLKSISE